MSDRRYEFDGLPVDAVPGGTTVLVVGESSLDPRSFALRMVAESGCEAVVLVGTDVGARRLVSECRTAGVSVDPDRTAVIDCTGSRTWFVSARVHSVSGPADLGSIGYRFSQVAQEFAVGGVDGVGLGVCSLSGLLTASDLKPVSRFVSTVTGRVGRTGGLGVFVVDPSAHDERTVETVAGFCGGRIRLAERNGRRQLRVSGLSNRPERWVDVESASD